MKSSSRTSITISSTTSSGRSRRLGQGEETSCRVRLGGRNSLPAAEARPPFEHSRADRDSVRQGGPYMYPLQAALLKRRHLSDRCQIFDGFPPAGYDPPSVCQGGQAGELSSQ